MSGVSAQSSKNGGAPRDVSKTSLISSASHISSRPSFQGYVEEVTPPKLLLSEATVETISHAILAVCIYLALLFLWKFKYFVPFDSGFAIAVLWFSSMACGMAFKMARLPQLLGMLCAGILVKNCGDLTRGMPDAWGEVIRAWGLVNILMRGGLEMDVGAVKRLGMGVVRLTVMPGVSEAVAAGVLAIAVFQMPFILGLAFGFILAAVSPAVVVGGMFDMQAQGYGVVKGIPTLVVAAASFDDVVAISGFSIFIGIAVGSGGNVAMDAIGGVLSVVGGIIAGTIGGVVLSATKLWNTPWKRALALILLAIIFKFGFKALHYDGAGALAALVMAAVASQLWTSGRGVFAAGPDEEMTHRAEHDLCLVWRLISEPLLFGVIGSALDFRNVEASSIPKAVLLILGCVLVRTAAAFVATCGCGFSTLERTFIALAWSPKATVQAALGAVPLAMIKDSMKPNDPDFTKYEKHGLDILTTAVFSILLTAPFGLIVIQKLGPRWLERVEEVTLVNSSLAVDEGEAPRNVTEAWKDQSGRN